MDQFLPGDISVMVLKYLASSGCESSVISMIDEMPVLQFYVPKQPPGISKSDFVRMLGRPSLTPSLIDVLNDYGQAKTRVTDLVFKERSSDAPLRLCDSLLSHIETLSCILNDIKKMRSNGSTVFKPAVFEKAINTENSIKVTKDADTQTVVEAPVIELGSPGDSMDVPLLFYNSLISDSHRQEKLAMAINEHLTDSSSSKNDVLQKVCSTAESEVDRFLVDFLKDMPTSSDIDVFSSIPSIIPDKAEQSQQLILNEEGGLSNLFQDANSVLRSIVPVNGAIEAEALLQNPLIDTNSSKPSNEVDVVTVPVAESIAEDKKKSVGTQRLPKKRIMPTPVVQTDKPHPVFEKINVVEQSVSSEGLLYSVHKTVPVITEWHKLGRRPIAPKIPSPVSQCGLPISNPQVLEDNIKPIKVQKSLIVSENKRKAKISTPIKLTPEKAKNLDFFLVCHDTPKAVTTSVNADSTTYTSIAKDTLENQLQPTDSLEIKEIQTPVDKPDQISCSYKACNTVEVTPILDVPNIDSVSSIQESVSPRLLRLIASAQKIRATSTQVNLVRRSYSTPRKKKHVRSLLFTTPPSLKNQSPNSPSQRKVTNEHGVSLVLPLKRKCGEDDFQPKSKKRLQWLDNDAYRSSAFPDRNFTSTRVSESMLLSANKIFQTINTKPKQPILLDKTELPAVSSIDDTQSLEYLSTSNTLLKKSITSKQNSNLPEIPEEIINIVQTRPEVSSTLVVDNANAFLQASTKPPEEHPVLVKPPPVSSHLLSETVETSATQVNSGSETKTIRQSSIVGESKKQTSPNITHKTEANIKNSNKSQTLMTELFGSDDSDEEISPVQKKQIKKVHRNRNNKYTVVVTSEVQTKDKQQSTGVTKLSSQKQIPKSPIKNKVARTSRLEDVSSAMRTPPKEKIKKCNKADLAQSPKRKSRLTSALRQELGAAKAASKDAILLGNNSVVSTNANMNTANMITVSNTLSSSFSLIPNPSHPVDENTLSAPVLVSEQASPLKTPIIFNIIPPLGFPDPTPTKPTVVETTLRRYSTSPLVTPLKIGSLSNSSPTESLPLPSTPRYIINDFDADTCSSSLGGTYVTPEIMYPNFTPSKFLRPPPTPGRNLFVDEHNESNFPTVSLPSVVQDKSDVQHSDIPLDLSSPVAPHRKPQLSVCQDVPHENMSCFSPAKHKPSIGGLANNTKFTALMDQSVKNEVCEFQVPKGAPKKASPPGRHPLKNLSLALKEVGKLTKSSASPADQSKEGTKTPDISPFPINPKTVNGIVRPSFSGMRFVVDGRTKVLSMSEQQSLLGLLEMRNHREVSKPATIDKPLLPKKEEPQPHQANRLFKAVDLNHFLNNVVHKMSSSSKEPKK